jgi:hypothetical protein
MSNSRPWPWPLFTIILGNLAGGGPPPPESNFLLLDGTEFELLDSTFFLLLET